MSDRSLRRVFSSLHAIGAVIAIMYELMIDLNKRLFVYAQMSMKQQTVCIIQFPIYDVC